ncbi:MAG: CTP synthase [Planctomycetaceae bacterium]|jgi:CTP synthase|nr:CTP synthase [Planctomycetaceae bacterium]
MPKYIFVTGGVVSSLGKGLTSASIGMLLEHRGLNVRLQKLDPYINADPGLFSPDQHGEVYLLDDGTAADPDLGHYERFTNCKLTWNSSWTTGQIYQRVLEKERCGEYQGKTVQVIPHITDEIKQCLSRNSSHADIVITEIGGTVGDIESLPHLEAIRQFSLEAGKENCLFIHLTLIPFLKAAKELKTKPAQHSVGQLRQIGIQPDILICRTEMPMTAEDRAKIGLFCNIAADAVIEERDKGASIYEVPIMLSENKLDQLIANKLHLEKVLPLDLTDWHEMLDRLRRPQRELTAAVVGEYAAHPEAYRSTYEALVHAGIKHRTKIRILRVPSKDVLTEKVKQDLLQANVIIVTGNYGESELDGKLTAVQIARENGIPFLGIGLGMECAVIEFARNVLKMEGANSTEYDQHTPYPVICLPDDRPTYNGGIYGFLHERRGYAFRCGTNTAVLRTGSRIAAVYGNQPLAAERFRHRYEVNKQQLTGGRDTPAIESTCFVFSAMSPDGMFVQAVELADHPFFVAVQFHPEFKSQPVKPHPLFAALIGAAVK